MALDGVATDTVDQELEERFAELLETYAGQKGALIPLLQGAQAIFRYLPENVMRRVADAAGEPLSKVLGVATFYAQFRLVPQARHAIRCCHGTACHVSGAVRITEDIERFLGVHAGENTPDMMFALEEVHCVGACGMAPVVMIDDRAYGKLTPEKAVGVVKDFRAVHGDGDGGHADGNGGRPADDAAEDEE